VTTPLRLMIFDRTCVGRVLGLSRAWSLGARWYRWRGWLDATRGVASWDEAFAFLDEHQREHPIGQVQFWGHGKWGDVRVAGEALSCESLRRSHPHAAMLARVRARLAPDALVWLRTCESFGAERGRRFARELADFMGTRVAGHTYVIGPWQSGLHALAPGAVPDWSADEGLEEGTGSAPKRAKISRPGEPRTIHCLQGELPDWA
jgi:hypothetical protein